MEEQRGPLYTALMYQSSALTLMYCLELMGSQGSYSLRAFLERIENDEGKAHASLLKDSRIMEIRVLLAKIEKEHPKIQRLIELVKEHHHPSRDNPKGNSSRVLVFTQYRDTARHLTDVLSRHGIKSSRFVGQAKREGDRGMKQKEQAAILESFRNGDFEVLVATSIAEEGLDIPEVDLVVFYELIPSEIRYIQRKGRTGRKTAGSVVILAAKEDRKSTRLNSSHPSISYAVFCLKKKKKKKNKHTPRITGKHNEKRQRTKHISIRISHQQRTATDQQSS